MSHLNGAGQYRIPITLRRHRRTAEFLPKSDELRDGDIGALDAPNHRPLALKVDGSGYHIGDILYSCENQTIVVTTIQQNGSALRKIKWSFNRVHMSRRLIGVGQVVHEKARLEERIFQNLMTRCENQISNIRSPSPSNAYLLILI